MNNVCRAANTTAFDDGLSETRGGSQSNNYRVHIHSYDATAWAYNWLRYCVWNQVLSCLSAIHRAYERSTESGG